MSKQKRLELFKDEWKDCSNCNLSANRTQVVFGRGNLDTSLMVIGEAPGLEEDAQGIPFTGEDSDLFDKILSSVDIKREDIWITNTCLCMPPSDKKPRAKEIKACQERLLVEISIIKPQILVLMGNIPLFSFTKLRGITKNRGWLETPFNMPIYATLHPASLFHGGEAQIDKKKHMIWDDWKAIAAKLEELSG